MQTNKWVTTVLYTGLVFSLWQLPSRGQSFRPGYQQSFASATKRTREQREVYESQNVSPCAQPSTYKPE
jgi:hypothetical protein